MDRRMCPGASGTPWWLLGATTVVQLGKQIAPWSAGASAKMGRVRLQRVSVLAPWWPVFIILVEPDFPTRPPSAGVARTTARSTYPLATFGSSDASRTAMPLSRPLVPPLLPPPFPALATWPSPPTLPPTPPSLMLVPQPGLALATEATTTAAAEAAGPPHDGPEEVDFYVYRAQSEAHYPLENVNAADLAGALWYLHHEVVPATPRKYHIDRIRRYRVRSRPTREFWNVHHSNFGPFFAYDGGRCTTPNAGQHYHQYGFVIGCQFVPLAEGAYMADHQTTVACDYGTEQCKSPLWFAMPGPCPSMGLQQQDLKGNSVELDVSKGKSPDCLRRMPGGRCSNGGPPTGAPDCTYSVEEAGEIMLDELAGIQDYNDFWNVSFYRCQMLAASAGNRSEPCVRNTEYSGAIDKGIGNHFWDGRLDKANCSQRVKAAEALFRKHYPRQRILKPPVCDFDMVYKAEFTWPVNHTGAAQSDWWAQRM
mmetsp:Transcript_97589/g.254485  ORF Transcript_97589/g.254485 Transcript_97589/m.254485 type:complete len:480 (+) Transcript_97589:702-2141(+)